MLLLINDDGIHAPGLRELYRALRSRTGRPVLAVAPVAQHSGQSHAITLDRGLSVVPILEEDFFGFAIDGTPADCLKLSLKVLCQPKPRLVVSGINDGPNVGRSLFYSGTVAAAMEAAVEGYPALAVSADVGAEEVLPAAADYAATIIHACVGRRELRGLVLNLNLPAIPREQWKPLRIVHHGRSGFRETYSPMRKGNRLTWHLSGTRVELPDEGETDAHALADGHPTLTVLKPDLNLRAAHLPQRLMDKLGALATAAPPDELAS